MVQLSHPYVTTDKTIALTIWTFVSKVMSLFLNLLSRFATAYLPRSKCLLINFMAVVTIHSDFGAKENKICHCYHFFPLYLAWSYGTGCHDTCFLECWVLSWLFHSPLSPSSRGFLVPLHFLPLEWYSLHIWGCWYFSWKSWFQLMIHPAQYFAWCNLHIS